MDDPPPMQISPYRSSRKRHGHQSYSMMIMLLLKLCKNLSGKGLPKLNREQLNILSGESSRSLLGERRQGCTSTPKTTAQLTVRAYRTTMSAISLSCPARRRFTPQPISRDHLSLLGAKIHTGADYASTASTDSYSASSSSVSEY
jgi:hypothetical protein